MDTGQTERGIMFIICVMVLAPPIMSILGFIAVIGFMLFTGV